VHLLNDSITLRSIYYCSDFVNTVGEEFTLQYASAREPDSRIRGDQFVLLPGSLYCVVLWCHPFFLSP